MEQLALFERLRAALRTAAGTSEVLPLKGFGLYALTGREEHARFSADLDVIGADSEAVVKAALTLTEDGYHYHGEEHPYVFAHMRQIEVHARYIVTGFAAGHDPAAYDPSQHQDALWLPTAFTQTTVTYNDLASDAADTGEYRTYMPSIEMALLIRCAHIYVGYAMHPRPLPVATVRVDELAQVLDLIRHPSFRLSRFREIYRDFHADLVVSFVRQLCREFFGRDPFGPSGEPVLPAIEHAWFPQNLWWDGIGAGLPVSLGWNPHDLLVRGTETPDLVTTLNPMPLPVTASNHARIALLGRQATPGARFVGLNHREELKFAEIEFELRPQVLRTVVYLPRTPDDRMSAVGVASGDSRVELFFKPREPIAEFSDWSVDRLPQEQLAWSASVEGDRHVLTIELPWVMFGYTKCPERGESIHVTVRARQQMRPWGAVTAGLLLPACIVRSA